MRFTMRLLMRDFGDVGSTSNDRTSPIMTMQGQTQRPRGQLKSGVSHMNTLIVILGASGDGVRTTSLLSQLNGQISCITAPRNLMLLDGLRNKLCCSSW